MPFAVLQSPGEQAGRFAIQDYDLAVAPSARSLLHGPGAASAPTRMLLVADPVYAKDDVRLAMPVAPARIAKVEDRGGILDLFRGESGALPLQRLPGTAAEATAIRALFKKDDIDALEGTGAAATVPGDGPASVPLHPYRVARSRRTRRYPNCPRSFQHRRPARQPIDGRVFAGDLLNVRMNTELVVLSVEPRSARASPAKA